VDCNYGARWVTVFDSDSGVGSKYAIQCHERSSKASVVMEVKHTSAERKAERLGCTRRLYTVREEVQAAVLCTAS
jgi:hypothetical protein